MKKQLIKKKFGEYYLGLDIGTDSMGWAVTDLDYNVQKLNGKSLWGVRLFDSAKTAEECRMFRSARRRQQRKVQRIKLLQELFAKEICKKDAGFYLRLAESKFYEEDKTNEQPNTLFHDKNFTDKDLHKLYPTIYHLRQALIKNTKPLDVRLVYLAIHHIIKHRGHFLFEGQGLDSIYSFASVYKELKTYLYDEFDINFECTSMVEVENILKDRNLGVTNKKTALIKLFNAETKQEKAIISLLSGGTVNLSELFLDDELKECEKPKICFSGSSYDEDLIILRSILLERSYLLEKLKAIYDWAILAEIRKGEQYLSFAKVNVYEKHKKDLAILKKVIKESCPEKYKDIFAKTSKNDNNYCAYIGMNKKNGKKQAIEKTCLQEEFCKYLSNILKDIDRNDEQFKYLMIEIENGSLMPKQVLKNNGVIPYQIHFEELKIILQNASSYLSFLNETDEQGLSIKDKIIKIMKFRIPYYVGPLNDYHKGKNRDNCWIVKRSNERIYPWNFKQVVDVEASAEEFIKRMTNKCTYLIGADVVPKDSLLYSKFMVLNELNNLKINNEGISVELKKKIYKDLFEKYKKVTEKKLKKYLQSENIIIDQDEISGIDGDFKSSLSSYLDMKSILGDKVKQKEVVEDIIESIVLFSDDKKLLKQKIKNKYGKILTEEEIKNVISKRYSGWGRLSKEFLEDIIHVDKVTGECLNIITVLYETNNNLMQLLGRGFTYSEAIEKYNNERTDSVSDISYELVDELHVSPSVKRMLWQALVIIKELKNIMQHEPKKIFIEMARGAEEKKRTESRKSKLTKLYEACKKEGRDGVEEIGKRADGDLRSDRLYLYYTQMGRCMYSGEVINIAQLNNKNIYDVDHIFPRSKTKDDSLDNRVLVKRDLNAKKSDIYPLPAEIRAKQQETWKFLLAKGFISKKKYDRLTRKEGFSEEELSDFIARQLVETRQTTKAAADILKRVFSNSEIVYVKAGNISDFRHKYDLLKVREINDFHHAQDAYLNIVVGNVYHTKFTSDPLNYIKTHKNRDYSLTKMYDFDVVRGDTVAWKAENGETLSKVKQIMQKNNVLFTRYATEGKGTFFKQQILKKGHGQVPIKGSDTRLSIEKYGGYDKAAGAYFMLVEHVNKKGKKIRTIEFVPIYLTKQIGEDIRAKERYCMDDLNLNQPKVLLPKIKFDTLFKVDGSYMHLSSRTGQQLKFKGANQLCVSKEEQDYIKKIMNYINRRKTYRSNNIEECKITEYDKIIAEQNLKIYDMFLSKLEKRVYKSRLSAQIITLTEKRDRFKALEVEKQCVVLSEVLHMFQCNILNADLSLIGGAKFAGIMVISNEISKCAEALIINQSPTGIFEQKIDLLKI
ncbi:MAG: type II CRISPR RNA-guided endonuclease Cas9 [Tissierellia bacterium]|nr:type II CRISPR RNA-guided endonuclease Cas9 [Tissierellia bacterium]